VGLARHACFTAQCDAAPGTDSECTPFPCRDEPKLRAALILVSSHDSKPLRLEVTHVVATTTATD
jgi:hypothetical protein